MTLEWVGTISGKRESRRFEGDHMLIQQDVVEQRQHADVVSLGGWAIDLHPWMAFSASNRAVFNGIVRVCIRFLIAAFTAEH